MTWSVLFRLRRYLRESLWVAPVVGGVLGWVVGISSSDFGTIAELPVRWQYSSSTADSVLASVVAASVGLIGFVVTVSVLIVQMATGTFSARYMRIFYRDRAFKAVLAVLIGTFTFSYTLLRHVEANSVPNLGVTLAGAFLGLGIILFVVFLDRAIHRLRPVAVAALVAKAGRRALQQALAAAARPDAPVIVPAPYEPPGEPSLVVRMLRGGAIQALDVRGLGRWAHASSSLVVLRHPVGDFVSAGAPLMEVYGPEPAAGDEARLRSMVALGVERTIEQDPAFAVRIMVDIAVRALSPAVNDPTTAVQVLDHLEDLLRQVGQTDLSDFQDRAAHGRRRRARPARAALGRLPHAQRDGDPRVRSDVDPGRPAAARLARVARRGGAAGAASGRPRRAGPARCSGRREVGGHGRPRSRGRRGSPGNRRADGRRAAPGVSAWLASPLAAELTRAEGRSLVLVFLATTLGAVLSRWHIRFVLPTVVVEIVLGILIGPEVLGIAHVNVYITFLSQFGLALLFFFAGLEVVEHHVQPQVLRRGTIGWGVSLAIGLAVGVVLQQAGVDAEWWLLAVALATTALGTLVPILSDAQLLPTPLGRAVLGTGVAGEFWPIIFISVFLTSVYGALTEVLLLVGFGAVVAGAARIALQARPPRLLRILQDTLHTTGQVGVRASIFLLALLVFVAADAGFEFVLGAFAAGLVVGLALDSEEGRLVRLRLEGIGFGFLVPVYFVVTGMNFDLDSLLTAEGIGLAALFLALLLVTRGAAALLWLRELGARSTASLALFAATGLPLIVAIVGIGMSRGAISKSVGASLIGAGMVSVLVYPLLAMRLAGRQEGGVRVGDAP